MNVLVVDVGGTHVKILATGENQPRECVSGPALTPKEMVVRVKKLAGNWAYEAVSIGYPGAVRNGRVTAEPFNLGPGWVGFDFAAAFGYPLKLLNDAAMQALGSYQGGTMLFLGLGTGLGTALVVDGVVIPLEVGHLPYRKRTFEDYLGIRGLQRLGRKKWEKHVGHAVEHLTAAFLPDDVVLGGGNAKRLGTLPPGCRLGDNHNAFVGGFRLWELAGSADAPVRHARFANSRAHGKDGHHASKARPSDNPSRLEGARRACEGDPDSAPARSIQRRSPAR